MRIVGEDGLEDGPRYLLIGAGVNKKTGGADGDGAR